MLRTATARLSHATSASKTALPSLQNACVKLHKIALSNALKSFAAGAPLQTSLAAGELSQTHVVSAESGNLTSHKPHYLSTPLAILVHCAPQNSFLDPLMLHAAKQASFSQRNKCVSCTPVVVL